MSNQTIEEILKYKADFEKILSDRAEQQALKREEYRIIVCKECNRKNTIPLDPITETREVKCRGKDCDNIIYKLLKPIN